MKKPIIENPSTPEARGNRIKLIRTHLLNQTREEFCKHSDIAAQSLKGWELAWGGGLSQLGAEKIVRHAKQLDIYCTVAWLLHGIGAPATHLSNDLEFQKPDDEHIAKELLVFREIPDSIDTLIQDDAMLPYLTPGTYVGGIIAKQIDMALGKDCIVIDDKNKLYVRVLKRGDNSNRYNLICLNQQAVLAKREIKNIKIKAAAPIIWIRKPYRDI